MRRLDRTLLVLVAAMSWATAARAQISIGRNQPDLDWWIVESAHFRAVYHTGAGDLAEAALRAAEDAYAETTSLFGTRPKGRLTLVIIDYDDISNGLARALGHWTYLYGQPPKKETTGPLKWMPRVTAHEFVHQVTFLSERNFLGTPWELLSLSTLPAWYLEGVAQYVGETWDANRDMLVRVAAANDALLPLKKLGGFVGTDRIGSRLVYEQGHSLVRYLARTYGADRVGRIARKHRGLPLGFTLTLKRAVGVSHRQLYNQWKQKVAAYYKRLWRQGERVGEIGRRIPTPLQGTYGVRWSPDGRRLAVVGVKEFDEEVARLYVCNRDGSGWRRLDEPGVSAFFSWSPDGRRLVYSKRRLAAKGRYVSDLFVADVNTGNVRPLTRNLRATDPAWSPNGRRIAFVINQGSRSNLATIDSNGGDLRLLTNFSRWTDVFTPAWSPDGTRLAFSLFDTAGHRDLALIRTDGSGFRRLTDHPEDDRYPAWSPDGTRLAFISYRNGAPNLYLLDPGSGDVTPLTASPGGVFNPAFSPDGGRIAVVVFEDRYRVDAVEIDWRSQQQKISLRTAQFSPPEWLLPPAGDGRQQARSFQVAALSDRRPYRSWTNVRSLLLLPALDEDEAGLQFGLLNFAGDPLGKHSLTSLATYGKRPHVFLDYTNRQLVPTLRVSVFHRTIQQGAFLLPELELNEIRSGVVWTALLPFNFGSNVLSRHLLFSQGAVSRTRTLDRVRFEEMLKPQFLPFSGWDNRLGLGYQWSYSRPDVAFDIQPKSGAFFGVSVARADGFLGSDLDYTRVVGQVALRRELPWRENVVAARVVGLVHQGDQPLQDLIGIGSSTVRGLQRSQKGDRLVFANVELRPHLVRDLGLNLGLLYAERFTSALFLDAGKAWGTDLNTFIRGEKTSFGQAPWLASVGAELRGRFWWLGKFPFVVRVGYGVQVAGGEDRDWYWRVGPVF